MRIGVSTASLFNKVPTESSFDILRTLRADTTEIFLNSFCEYEKPFIDALVARKGNINVHSVHAVASQFEPELYSSNQRQRADAELYFRKVCYAGHALGAKYYSFHGPVRLRSIYYAFDYARLGDRTNQIIDIAESYGVKLSYENTHWTYFSEPDFYKQLFKHCPRLCGTLNIRNAILSGNDPYAFMDVFGDNLSTVHICDMNKNMTAMPGKGKLNFEKIFKTLDKMNYSIPVLIDVHSRDYADIKELKDSFDYLNTKLIKIRN